MLERIQETAAFLKDKMHTRPETAIILGTGLGAFVGSSDARDQVGSLLQSVFQGQQTVDEAFEYAISECLAGQK